MLHLPAPAHDQDSLRADPTGLMHLGNVRDGLAAGFSLDHLGRAPARFDASLMPRERVRERFAALIKKP